MSNIVFVAILAAFIAAVLAAAFRLLPGERWQILAAIPAQRLGDGKWGGVNLTWYGVFNANAYVAGVALLFVLMGSVGTTTKAVLVMVSGLLLICVPASRLIARIVEKKPYTFTVGGASFIGMVLAPWVVILLNVTLGRMEGFKIHLMSALSGLAVSYAFGEGLGRLACISFGCCYGKRVSSCSPPIARLFRNFSFVFHGSTKKIAYEGGMEGEPVLPVQAITSVLSLSTSLLSMLLFLDLHFLPAFILCIVVTQGWRAVSEVLREDYRGGSRMTVYQIMSIVGAIYSVTAAYLFTLTGIPFLDGELPVKAADILTGLGSIWNPGMLLFLQALWGVMFLFTGRSMVTGSNLSFYVHKGRI